MMIHHYYNYIQDTIYLTTDNDNDDSLNIDKKKLNAIKSTNLVLVTIIGHWTNDQDIINYHHDDHHHWYGEKKKNVVNIYFR